MRIIRAGYEIIPRDGERGNLSAIELAARTCYKSEDKIAEGSADRMVQSLIQRKHNAMLEHGDYVFALDPDIVDNVRATLQRIAEMDGRAIQLTLTSKTRPVISGNIRAWRELMECNTCVRWYFAGHIDRLYTQDILPEEEEPDARVRPLGYGDLRSPLERWAHLRQTVRFTVDRGVTHEFVRHREMSFAQESTRWCNYSQGRFGKEITVIEPCTLAKDTEAYSLWKRACMSAETAYFTLLNEGLLPQEARAVLPHSTKAELVMTGTLSQWQHFFNLRALEMTGKAHPQAVEVAKPLLIEMANRFRGVIRVE